MSTLVWVMNQGQTGKALRGQLRDAAGAVDLDLFTTVHVQVAKIAGTLLVNAVPVLDANQTTEVLVDGVPVSGKGWLTFTTEATAAALAIRTSGYLLSFKCMDGLIPHYFPLSEDLKQTYGKLVVHDPLG